MVAGAAVQKFMTKLESEQEILMNIANMTILTFVAESALLRAWKLADQRGETAAAFELDIMRCFLYDAADAINIQFRINANDFHSFNQGLCHNKAVERSR